MTLVLLGRAFNKAVKKNENILEKDIVMPSAATPVGVAMLVKVSCSFNVSVPSGKAMISLVRKYKDATIYPKLNEGKQMDSDTAYIFDLIVDEGESINFRLSEDGTILKLSVSESKD